MSTRELGWLSSYYPDAVERRETEGKPGRDWPAGSQGRGKITLLNRVGTTITEDIEQNPPHFIMSADSGGSIFQCVNVNKAAYGLRDDQGDLKSGQNITVMIMGLNKSDGSWWTAARYDRVAWLLYVLNWHNGILNVGAAGTPYEYPTPFKFLATAEEPNKTRQDKDTFARTSGIVGIQHNPRSNNRWGPGFLYGHILTEYMQRWKKRIIDETGGSGSGPPGNTGPSVGEGEYPGPDDYREAEELREYSMEGKPLRFNPVLHELALPKRVNFSDLSGTDDGFGMDNYRVESSLAKGEEDTAALEGLRLGRIIQHEMSAGMAAVNTERYGFRFLYNPSSVTISASRNDSLIINPQSSIGAIVSGINQNFQVISFQAFLNRAPDVLGAGFLSESNYYTGIWDETDLEGIKRYGTHWDLEYLYRLCNGIFNQEDRGSSGDIGVLIPSNARILLSRGQNFFGFVESVSWQDQQFAPGMIPIHTTVDIRFRRHFDMTPVQLEGFWESIKASGLNDRYNDETSGGGGEYTRPEDAEPYPTVGKSYPRTYWDQTFPGWEKCTNQCAVYAKDKPRHQGANDGRVPPVLVALQEELYRAYPDWYGIAGIVGDKSHSYGESDHNPTGSMNAPIYGTQRTARAIDIRTGGLHAAKVIDVLKRDPRTYLVIHKEKIYSRNRDLINGRYFGHGGHDDHIHLSLRSDTQAIAVHVENDTTPWGF